MLLLGCILSVLLHVAAGFTTSLSGKWSVISANYQSTQNVHGGWDMYSAFYDEKSFGDPLEGYRDIESRWLAKRNWTFIHKFSWHRDQRDFHSLELYIDGIDGFGCLFINDRKLSCLDNSFLNEFWRIDGLVKDGAENILRIEFKSSIETAMQIANSIRRHGDNIPPPDCWPKSYRGECHVNLIRTTQASFGWDWGPAFPIQGFWNIPKLVYSRYGIRLGEGFKFFSTYRQRFDGESLWYADVLIEVRQIDNVGLLDACLLLDLLEKPNVHLRRCFHMGSQPSKLDVHAVLLEGETDITPWWPNNIETGPHVYTLRVRLVGPSDELFDEAKHDVGFRTVELIQEHIDQKFRYFYTHTDLGRTFYFKINGKPVFIKGSNWIPARLLPGRRVAFVESGRKNRYQEHANGFVNANEIIQEDVDRFLESAVLAGVNMIRVWGGGRYESEEFYRKANRLGLMIWQDMMFACSTYADAQLRMRIFENLDYDTVEREITRQLRRLHAHPSIVIWVTNNEVEQAIAQGWYKPWQAHDPKLQQAYQHRFVDSILKVIEAEESSGHQMYPPTNPSSLIFHPRPILLSSPSNAAGGDGRTFDSLYDPQDPRYGDVHFYKYDGDLWSETIYPVSRMTTEFGIQSLPNPLAWRRSIPKVQHTDPSRWLPHGHLVDHREHQDNGLNNMYLPAYRVIGRPLPVHNPVENYTRYMYLTQINQAMAYKAHINRLMRHRCRLIGLNSTDPGSISGTGLSMGAMYWQLNDVWSAPTWSTLDATGQWKMAHYQAVRHCFRPGAAGRVALHLSNGYVEADWIPSEQRDRRRPHYYEVNCFTIRGFTSTNRWTVSHDRWMHHHLPPHTTQVNAPGRSNLVHLARWPLHPGNLQNRADWAASDDCPVHLFRASVGQMMRQCKCESVEPAACLVHVSLYGEADDYPGHDWIALGRPAEISFWPPTAGRNGLRISHVHDVGFTSTSSPAGVNGDSQPFHSSRVYELSVAAKSPELFVWLDLDPALNLDAWFSDNGFSLLAQPERNVTMYVMGNPGLSAAQLQAKLRIYSLAMLRQSGVHPAEFS